ncbi:MAG TPA: hypothetical protein VGL66_16685 [Caulobacteraceae bacterium]|jgi:hypothetical protein
MPAYRAYLLNAAGKIIWGDWIEATDQKEAEAKAHALCNEGTPVVELWQGARRLAELPCDTRTDGGQ